MDAERYVDYGVLSRQMAGKTSWSGEGQLCIANWRLREADVLKQGMPLSSLRQAGSQYYQGHHYESTPPSPQGRPPLVPAVGTEKPSQ
jgi:hypothetical protein